MKYLITKYKITLLFMFFSSLVFAGHEKGIESFKGNTIFSAALSSTYDNATGDITNKDQAMYVNIFDHSYHKVRYSGNWWSYLNLSDISNDVVLRFDDLERQDFQADWSMTVEYTIYFNADESFDNYEQGELEISYNHSTNYIDQQRKVFTTFGSLQAHAGLNPRVYIREVNVSGDPADQTLLATGDLDIYFDLELHTEKCYILQGEDLREELKDKHLYTFSNLTDYDYAEVTWAYVEGAEYYEFEWLFVDLGLPINEALTLGTTLTDYPNFDYNFNNAFGVSLHNNTFKIPLNYPTGLLLYRLRAVGYRDCDNKEYGEWSTTLTKGQIYDLTTDDYIVINGFETDKTWQSSSTFIEEGKHSDAITFYDGSLRPRQSIAVNKEANIGVVNTPVFDYSGRSTLTLAPFAVENSSLKYKTNVTEYPRASFDAVTTIDSPLDYTPQAGELSASEYYSSNNTYSHSHKDYIPHAGNQPFSRTLLKNDGTNRIQEQGGMGPNFQIGSGRTTKHYYTKPSQRELDMLFGNYAGYADRYTKEIAIDANGQGTYVVKNEKGNIVVSGLYGEAPTNLDPLPTASSTIAETEELDISYLNFQTTDEVVLNYNFDIITETNSSDIKFDYDLEFHNGLPAYGFPPNSKLEGFYPVTHYEMYDQSYDNTVRNFQVEFEINSTLSTIPVITGNHSETVTAPGAILLPGSYTYTKRLRLTDDLASILATFKQQQQYINGTESEFQADYQSCGCQDECIGSLLKPGYWFVPTAESGSTKYDYEGTSSGFVVSINSEPYFIVKQNEHLVLNSSLLSSEAPFLNEGALPTDPGHSNWQTFVSDVEHCVYSCDFPSAEFFSGFQDLATQVYPGTGDLWNLEHISLPINPRVYWVSKNILNLVDEDGISIDFINGWTSSSGSEQDKLEEFSTIKWLDDSFWESFENQWFKVVNPYNDEYVAGTELIAPLTREYYLKYILLPKHPDFDFLNGLFTDDFTSFYDVVGNNTVFVPYSTMPSWGSGTSNYFNTYAFEDLLLPNLNGSVNFSDLPAHYDPTVTVTYPGSIYNVETILEDFQGANNSIYEFIDGDLSGVMHKKFHGSPTVNKGLFNHNLSKETFFEQLYLDLRITRYIPQYLTQYIIANGPLSTGTSQVPNLTSLTYDDLTNLTPLIGSDFVWNYIDVNLIEGNLEAYLEETYPTSTVQIDIFKDVLQGWLTQNVFVKTKSGLAAEYFSASVDPLSFGYQQVQNLVNQQSALSQLVQDDFNQRIEDYINAIGVTYSGGNYNISLYGGGTLSFDINDAEASLFSSTGGSNLFSDFESYVNTFLIVSDLSSTISGYSSIHAACSTVVNSGVFNLFNYFTTFDCASVTSRQEEIRDAFISDEFFIYHYNDDLSPVFDETFLCSYVDYMNNYIPFEMPEGIADCYCNTIKELAIQHPSLSSITNIDDLTTLDITSNPMISEFILEELGFTGAQITATVSSFNSNLINSSTPGSCFHTNKSVNNLDGVNNDLIYDALCSPYGVEPEGTISCTPLTSTEIDALSDAIFDEAEDILMSEYEDWYLANRFTQLTETIKFKFPQKQYQQTLFYYDRAGHLVRTVSPNQVNLITDNNTLSQISVNRNTGSGFISHLNISGTEYKYNSLDQLVYKSSPNGGRTLYHYDSTGRLIASQTREQYNQADPGYDIGNHTNIQWFSYTLFDDLGRIKESGVAAGNYVSLSTDYDVFEAYVLSLERREVSITHYDESTLLTLPFTQQFLRNRVSWKEYYPVHPSSVGFDNDDQYYKYAYSKHFYSYDVHGNVTHYLVKHKVSAVSSISKYMTYTYDLISGNVKEFAYQPGESDQFYHRYYYDESNRLIEAESSDDNVIWETDAKYFYYPHGPLARVELGDKQVQGTDYAYTLHGWLKSVNGAFNSRHLDISSDGLTGSGTNMNRNAEFGEDELSYKIDYYDGDYSPITANPLLESFNGNASLYNGNISAIRYDISELAPIVYRYRYDQLQRLKTMNSYSHLGFALGYSTSMQYDPNGNIDRLIRKGESGSVIDDIHYGYSLGNDNDYLIMAIDDVDDPNLDDDYVSLTANPMDGTNERYHYDHTGNEIYKYRERGTNYDGHRANRWFYSGKVKSTSHVFSDNINNDNNPWRLNLFYDGNGHRIAKVLKTANDNTLNLVQGSHGYLVYKEEDFESLFEDESTYTYTYYINDPTGNTLATYNHKFENVSAVEYTLTEELDHFNIYGSSRLGTANRKEETKSWTVTGTGILFEGSSKLFDESVVNVVPLSTTQVDGLLARELGRKNYELSNHLGNVLTTVSDRKKKHTIGTGGNGFYRSDVLTYSDYYPFGMQMPGRKYTSADGYRYGFNGMEKDDEVKGVGNSYTTLFRQYDPRIGRWLKTDPVIHPWRSPYDGFGNNPIFYKDPLGNCDDCPDPEKAKEGDIVNPHGKQEYIFQNGGWSMVGGELPEVEVSVHRGNGTYAQNLKEGSVLKKKSFKLTPLTLGAFSEHEYVGISGELSSFGLNGSYDLGNTFAEGKIQVYGINAKVNGRLGTVNNNFFGSAEGYAFMAEAGGDIGIKWNEKGAYGAFVGAEAGAYALKGDASFGVTIYGTKLKLSFGGSAASIHAGAGLGFKTNPGKGEYTAKGKLHFGFGVGVKVGFEISNTKKK